MGSSGAVGQRPDPARPGEDTGLSAPAGTSRARGTAPNTPHPGDQRPSSPVCSARSPLHQGTGRRARALDPTPACWPGAAWLLGRRTAGRLCGRHPCRPRPRHESRATAFCCTPGPGRVGGPQEVGETQPVGAENRDEEWDSGPRPAAWAPPGPAPAAGRESPSSLWELSCRTGPGHCRPARSPRVSQTKNAESCCVQCTVNVTEMGSHAKK